MRHILKKLALAIAAISVLAGIPTMTANAASNGLGITPRKDYTLQPGAHVSDTLYINNLSQTEPLNLALKVIDFSAKDETGTPSLDLAANAPQTSWSIKPFIKLPGTVSVPAGKAVNVPITISIPSNQGAGSYYSAIEYTAENAPGQQNVTLDASSVSLIFVTVPGHAAEHMQLQQFGAFIPDSSDTTGNFSSLFFTSPPTTLAYVLQNQGNVAEQPTGSIVLKNMFGKQVKVIDQANPKSQLALINQTRRFEACIQQGTQVTKSTNGQNQTNVICNTPHLAPGRYTAELAVFYGLNNGSQQEIMGTTSFWYLPAWFIVVVAIVILAIVLGIYLLTRKLRGAKRTKSKKSKK